MNSVNIFGRLTDTPVLKDVNGTPITNFTVAVNRGDSATFVPVTAFSKQAELITKFLQKGDRLVVEGTLYSSKREIEGKKIAQLSVTAQFVHFVEPPRDSADPEPEPSPEPKPENFADNDLPF